MNETLKGLTGVQLSSEVAIKRTFACHKLGFARNSYNVSIVKEANKCQELVDCNNTLKIKHDQGHL